MVRCGDHAELGGIRGVESSRTIGPMEKTDTPATVHVDLAGHTALVTGAASGIGLAIAQRLSAAGAAVVMIDRDRARLEEHAVAIGADYVRVDLSDATDVAALNVTADIIVNNAGLQHVAAVEDFPVETFSYLMDVMVEAPFRLIRAALPGMYERGWGRVINISSVHGLVASPYKSAYVAAKHGLEGLSKVVALEGGGRGVTSNCICPGYARTQLVEQQIAAQAKVHGLAPEDVVRDILLAPTAIKRLVEPAEIAEFVAYLCSSSAAFINGASIPIDGGWTAS
jgi:3-hydroxybutyrate dehydrogenase